MSCKRRTCEPCVHCLLRKGVRNLVANLPCIFKVLILLLHKHHHLHDQLRLTSNLSFGDRSQVLSTRRKAYNCMGNASEILFGDLVKEIHDASIFHVVDYLYIGYGIKGCISRRTLFICLNCELACNSLSKIRTVHLFALCAIAALQ